MKAFGSWCGRVWRKFRVARWIVLGLVALLVAARLALPYAVERYVNDQLNHSPDYTGRVGKIHIQTLARPLRHCRPQNTQTQWRRSGAAFFLRAHVSLPSMG